MAVRGSFGRGNGERRAKKKTLKIFDLKTLKLALCCSHNPLVVGSSPTRPTMLDIKSLLFKT